MAALFAFLIGPVTILITLLVRQENALLIHLLSLSGIGIGYLCSFYGYGSLLLRFFPLLRKTSRGEEITATLIAGVAFLYFIFLLLNIIGMFLPPVVILIISTGAISGIWFLRKEGFGLILADWNFLDRLLLCGVFFLAGIQLLCAWTPLIFYDAIQYHLLAPVQYLKAGRFVYIPLNFSTNMPLSVQLVFGSSAAFDPSGEAYKFLTTLSGLGMSGITALVVKGFGRRASLLAAGMTFSCSGFWLPQTLGVIDLTVAALLFAGSIFLYAGLTSSPPAIWIAALALGLATGSRYPASLMTAIIFLCITIFALSVRKLPPRRIIQSAFLCVCIVFVMVKPWIIKNMIFTGNPVYPLFQQQLDGFEWSAQDALVLKSDTVGDRFQGLNQAQKLAAPFKLLLSESYFGLMLFLCSLACLFRFPKQSQQWIFCLIGWIGLFVWGWIHPLGGTNLIRFNAVTLLFMIASAASLLSSFRIGTAIAIVLSGATALFGFLSVNQMMNVKGSITNLKARLAFVRLNVPAYDAISFANQKLSPSSSRVFMLGETRSFYLRIPSFAPDAYHGTELASIFSGGPTDWERRLREMKITHILLSVPELNRLQQKKYLPLPQERLNQLSAWLKSLPVAFQDGRGTFLFSLPSR